MYSYADDYRSIVTICIDTVCFIAYRPCADYRPDLSLMYIFDVELDDAGAHATNAGAVPRINLNNITAIGTMHDHNSTKQINRPVDSEWLVQAFNKQAGPAAPAAPDLAGGWLAAGTTGAATLIPGASIGTFKVSLN